MKVRALLFLQPRPWMGVGGQRHVPAALPPGMTGYSIYRKLDGPQGRSERTWKISPPTGFRSPDRPTSSQLLYLLSYSTDKYILKNCPKLMITSHFLN